MSSQPNFEDDSEPNVYSNFPKDSQNHIEDLNATPDHKPQVLVWIPSLTYVVYMHRALKNIIITLMFEWSMPIFHPFNFLLLITVFPTLIIGIIILEVGLHVGLKFGLGTLIQKIANEWGHGLSIVNWWDPRIFTSEVDDIVKGGIKALDAPLPPPLPEEQLDDSIFGVEGTIQHRGFHLDIAEFLLFMSCIIYERNDEKVRMAHKLTTQIANGKGSSIKSEEIKIVTDLLRESEIRIHQQASKWGLTFTSLSELNSLGGPFSGMFWSEQHNFIVVVFKGTTPLNFEDFVIDLMFQRVDARSFVFGEVHEGFYTSLFPQSGYSTRSSRSSPYISMVRAIRAKAADILERQGEKVKINVYVTGHSLGAALASLFYSRLIKSPGDLGPNCILRDGYMFGSPSVGDADFAAEFASYSNSPYDRQGTLWRIIDDSDIITKLPPGWDDPSVRRVIDKSSVLNYAHIGEGIRFFQDGSRPASTRNLFSSGKEPIIVERDNEKYSLFGWRKLKTRDNDTDDDSDNEKETSHLSKGDKFKEYKHKPGSPLRLVEKLLPTPFRNHLPARYFSVMQRSRKYFDGTTTTTVDDEDTKNFASGSKSFKEFANKHIINKSEVLN
uniref:Phospholipase A1-II 1 n=1 Tax=Anthurium amnicola TaxID=1678845 RepID=A0A1D1ZB98_9ARAE